MIIIEFYKTLLPAFMPALIIAILIQIAASKGKSQDLQIKRLERENRLKKAQSKARIINKENFIKEAKTDLENDYYENGRAYKDFQNKLK